ncbi:MAG: hypothetical protein ACTHZI_07755 [Luteimonas sp.]
MRRWLLRIGVALLALLVTLAAVWGASRLLGPTAEQRRAVEVFEQLPPPQGSNAFPALWLLQWDVPESEQAAVVAEDAERFRALPPWGDPARGEATLNLQSVAAGRYEDLRTGLADDPASCGPREGGCLERVRAARDAHAERLEQSARLVDRVQVVFDHAHYRSLLPPAVDGPIPPLSLLSLGKTRHALQFVDGETDAALAGTCRRVDGWRRIAGNADSLLVTMYAVAGIQGDGHLLADMLAELPPGHALPSACAAALAPPRSDELSLCPAMRGEWEFGKSAFDALQADTRLGSRVVRWLLVDQEATAALSASNLAWACGEQAEQAVAQDRPMHPPQQDGGPWRFGCVANVAGCVLMEVARPAYADYGQRMQDSGARVRVLGTLAWLRERAAAGDARSAHDLLVDLPEGLRSPGRAVEVDPDGRHLRIELFDIRQDSHWRVPLPPELQGQPATP